MIGRFAGRYELLRRLGKGGMGEVFLARDLVTGTECALKRLRAGAAGVSARREFELPARLQHPAVVSVLEFAVAADGIPYYTMEYVPGVPADRALRLGDWPGVFFFAAEVASGLEALHGQGVVHGDLKPGNLLVLPGQNPGDLPAAVRMLDFGLAAVLGTGEGHRGTSGYAAPELVRGGSPSVAADLYGLGASLYAVSSGRRPFEGDTIDAVLRNQQAGPPSAEPLEAAGAPARFIQLVFRLMAPEPGERPRDAREVRRELESMHPAARRPLAVRLKTTVVVGRERELGILGRFARRGGRSRLVVVTGEAGIGKSALLRELGKRLAVSGRVTLTIPCEAAARQGSAGLTLLRALAAEAGGPGTGGNGAGEEPQDVLAQAAGVGEHDLDRIAEAAIACLRSITERTGAPVLLLDDADQLDPLSRALVRRLVLHPTAPPALWIWSRRGSGEDHPEDERALLSAGAAEALALARFDRTNLGRVVAARLNAPAPRDLETFLWDRAQGHPGMTVELLGWAAARGALAEDDAGLVTDAAALAALDVPASFEAMLSARVETLDPAARAAAVALAILSVPATLERVRGLEPGTEAAAIERLIESGLALRDADGRITLASRGVGQHLVQALPEDARATLHRRALAGAGLTAADRFRHLRGAGEKADALAAAEAAWEQQPDMGLAAEAAELAGAGAPAASWHERAGRELSRSGRYRSAAEHLAKALEQDPTSEERHVRRHLLSTAMLRAGEPAEVARLVAAALADDPPTPIRSRLLTNEAARLQSEGQMSASHTVGLEALALAEKSDDDEAVGFAAHVLVYALLPLGRLDEADTFAAQAADAFKRSGHVVGRLRAVAGMADLARARQKLGVAERTYREALAEARSQGLRLLIEELLNGLARVLSEAGRWEEIRELYAEASRLALEDQRPRGAAVAITNLAQMDGLTGRPAAARRQAIAAIRLSRAYLPRLEAAGWRALCLALRLAGRLRSAERAGWRASRLAEAAGFADELDWCRIELGRTLAVLGRWKESAELWDHALASTRFTGSVGHAVLRVLSGRAALWAGDAALAGARLAAVEDALKARPLPYAAALANQLRAELALHRGRIPEAMNHVERALAGFAVLPAPADRALALFEFGRLAMAGRGRGIPRVGEWLGQAAAGFERLGDHRARERALALHVEWLKHAATVLREGSHDRSLIEAVSQLLHSLSDLRELTQRAMQLVVEQLDAERGVLLLADPEGGKLVPMAECGAVDAETRSNAVGYSRQAVQRVTESGGSLLIADAPADPDALSESVVHLRLQSIVCVPLYLGGKVIGAVYLDSRRAGAFSDADRGLLEGFAHLMAVAIEKSRGDEEVRRANEMLVGENLSLRQEATVRFRAHRLLGNSLEMQRMRAMIERAALTQSTVMLTGENGTGKELIARILHHSGKRRLHPFVAVNCGAIPETLLESELFGILPNVATGVRGRDGRFKQADGGTLFLDEIGDMPLKQQVALLTAISSREITPVGGGRSIPIDVRIMAATNRGLKRMVEDGSFREDLYYRLNVIPIEVPPLRDRKADIPTLARQFVTDFAKLSDRPVPKMSAEFLAVLMQSDWPGNVRELQNYIERVMAMNPGNVLDPVPLPPELEDRHDSPRSSRTRGLTDMVEDYERRLIEEALTRAQGNQSLAARKLKVPEQAIRYRIRKYGLTSSRQKGPIRRNWR